jgi:hypothetical protein
MRLKISFPSFSLIFSEYHYTWFYYLFDIIFKIPSLSNRKFPSPNSSLSFLTRLSDFGFPPFHSLHHFTNSYFGLNKMLVSYYILYTGWSKSLFAPDFCIVIMMCTETFESPCTIHNCILYTTCSPCFLYKGPILKLLSNCMHDHSRAIQHRDVRPGIIQFLSGSHPLQGVQINRLFRDVLCLPLMSEIW